MAGEDAGLHEFHPDSLIVSKDNTQLATPHRNEHFPLGTLLGRVCRLFYHNG